jgi:PAS domain S-box-containing protein
LEASSESFLAASEGKRVLERHSELRWLASIVEFSDDAIISKDVHGVIMSWNRGAGRMLGYRAAEVIGKPVLTSRPRKSLARSEKVPLQ